MIYWILAFIAGAVLPLQIGVNNMIAKMSSSLWATALSFAVGMVTITLLLAALRPQAPTMQNLMQLPYYAWLGGVLGTFYICASIYIAPKIGALMLMALVIAGQLTAAILVDHFGAVGFPKQVITPGRIIGCLMILAGFLVIKKF